VALTLGLTAGAPTNGVLAVEMLIDAAEQSQQGFVIGTQQADRAYD
jgi:hypothetical protein